MRYRHYYTHAHIIRQLSSVGEREGAPPRARGVRSGSAAPAVLRSGEGCRQKLPPLLVISLTQAALDGVVGSDEGPAGGSAQLHARLFRRAATFAVVADTAGADQVLPAVASAAVAWNDMVER